MAITARSESVMEHKIISISSKRQITIPQKYFEVLGFDGEAECILQNGGIFLRPVRMDGNEFAEQILADLIEEGYSGTELLARFKAQSRKIRPAVVSCRRKKSLRSSCPPMTMFTRFLKWRRDKDRW